MILDNLAVHKTPPVQAWAKQHCELHKLSRVLVRLDGFKVEVAGKTLRISFAVGWKAYETGAKLDELLEGADRYLCANKALVKSLAAQLSLLPEHAECFRSAVQSFAPYKDSSRC